MPIRFLLALLTLALAGSSASGCRPTPPPAARVALASRPSEDLTRLRPEPIGAGFEVPPWIAHVNTVDLDRDGQLDVLAAEAQQNQILWIRQTAPGRFAEQVIARDVLAPVHVEAADLDGDQDLDVLVALMGYVFPNNDKIGSVLLLENDGHQRFTPHVVLEHTSRVTDVRAADFTGDGQLDLALAQFGFDQGEVRWLERTGPWEFRSHVLLELSGAINVCVADFNADGRPDIAALISQQWEEVHYFENRGGGAFARKRLWGSTNEDYGSSGMSVCDLNRDGRPDLLFSNGDGFGPAVLPGPRPWHGLQWLENAGEGFFRYHRIGHLAGAYGPMQVDLDGDGAMDVAAVSAYAGLDPTGKPAPALVWFRNDGTMDFTPQVLAYVPRDQVTLAVGDFDADGRSELVTGGFYVFAPYSDLARVTLWRGDASAP